MEILKIFIIISLVVWSSAGAVMVITDYKIKAFKEDQEEQFQSVTHKIDKIKWFNRDLEILEGRFNDLEEENKKLKTKLRKSRKENKELKEKVIYLIGVTETMFGPEDI